MSMEILFRVSNQFRIINPLLFYKTDIIPFESKEACCFHSQLNFLNIKIGHGQLTGHTHIECQIPFPNKETTSVPWRNDCSRPKPGKVHLKMNLRNFDESGKKKNKESS